MPILVICVIVGAFVPLVYLGIKYYEIFISREYVAWQNSKIKINSAETVQSKDTCRGCKYLYDPECGYWNLYVPPPDRHCGFFNRDIKWERNYPKPIHSNCKIIDPECLRRAFEEDEKDRMKYKHMECCNVA